MTGPSCASCKWASWKRRANGTLHPEGTGTCKWPVENVRLPMGVTWPVGIGSHPSYPYLRRPDLDRHKPHVGCEFHEVAP